MATAKKTSAAKADTKIATATTTAPAKKAPAKRAPAAAKTVKPKIEKVVQETPVQAPALAEVPTKKTAAAKKTSSVPAAQTTLSPNAAWPFPTYSKP